MNGPLWKKMNRSKGYLVATLQLSNLPLCAGVYAFYKAGKPKYVGKAACLANRLQKNHLRTSGSVGNSAFRRNVAESLNIATAADPKARRRRLVPGELQRLNEWVSGCKIRLIKCDCDKDAIALENKMKAEFKPSLTKR